jgi:hypothetical protein
MPIYLIFIFRYLPGFMGQDHFSMNNRKMKLYPLLIINKLIEIKIDFCLFILNILLD